MLQAGRKAITGGKHNAEITKDQTRQPKTATGQPQLACLIFGNLGVMLSAGNSLSSGLQHISPLVLLLESFLFHNNWNSQFLFNNK
jgi:hypothetical protein